MLFKGPSQSLTALALLHLTHISTEGFVLKDLRQHDLIAISLSQWGQHWTGRVKELGESEGSSQTITMGAGGGLKENQANHVVVESGIREPT